MRKVDIIWNITQICSWNCRQCCVDAVQVTKEKGFVKIASHGLTEIEHIPLKGSNIFEQVLTQRQKKGFELQYDRKIQVLDNLVGFSPKIDFSGGDPLLVSENFEILKIASARFGKENITLTATCAGLVGIDVKHLADYIQEFNFTYDHFSVKGSQTRSGGYATSNLKIASEFVKVGVNVRGECPLTVENCNENTLCRIYFDLHAAGVQTLLVMRTFPVGRGTYREADIPTYPQYLCAIQKLKQMEIKYGYPKVKLQCALKNIEPLNVSGNPCDLVRESLGLMADGTLLASPWAIGASGKPMEALWVLGNLSTTPLSSLLESDKAVEFITRGDENLGHCKIFSYLNSKLEKRFERVFDKADPLYITDLS